MLALTVSCAFSTTADAQLLKKLGNLAKTAVANETKSKINNEIKQSTTTESNTVESNTVEEPNRSSSNSRASEPKKEIRAYADASDYKRAKHMDWDYNSNMKDVEADMAYWLKRLRTSAEKNDKSQLDLEALDRLTKGRPSFDFMDKEYTDGMVT